MSTQIRIIWRGILQDLLAAIVSLSVVGKCVFELYLNLSRQAIAKKTILPPVFKSNHKQCDQMLEFKANFPQKFAQM